MTDPAVEAAQRIAALLPYGFKGRLDRDDMIAAAREALVPIREIHRPVLPPGIERCRECDVVWPCATATLIYATEELSDE